MFFFPFCFFDSEFFTNQRRAFSQPRPGWKKLLLEFFPNHGDGKNSRELRAGVFSIRFGWKKLPAESFFHPIRIEKTPAGVFSIRGAVVKKLRFGWEKTPTTSCQEFFPSATVSKKLRGHPPRSFLPSATKFHLFTARVAKNTVGSVKLGTLWPRVSTPKAYNSF